METPISVLAELYRQIDTLTFGYELNMGVPTEVRAFAAEIACEVVLLDDEEVVATAVDIDERSSSKSGSETLWCLYERLIAEPPKAYSANAELVRAHALRQIRIGIASKRFMGEYAERFPDRCTDEAYVRSEPYLQGNTVVYRTVGEYLGTKYPLTTSI